MKRVFCSTRFKISSYCGYPPAGRHNQNNAGSVWLVGQVFISQQQARQKSVPECPPTEQNTPDKWHDEKVCRFIDDAVLVTAKIDQFIRTAKLKKNETKNKKLYQSTDFMNKVFVH